MKTVKILCISLLMIASNSQRVIAQWQGVVYTTNDFTSVVAYGDTLKNAWLGGLNAVQIQMADLNNDGIKDLVSYDHINDRVHTFIKTSPLGIDNYVYNPQYESSFPKGIYSPIKGYLILKDYNCDGVPDLFTKGSFGVNVSKGYYQGNILKFTYYNDLFYPATFGPINVYVQNGDIPVIEDLDNDSDLDILAFDVQGTVVNYYKNIRADQSLPCDTIAMTFGANCWGQFSQGFYREAYLNQSCKMSEPSGIIYEPIKEETISENPLGAGTSKPTRHTGNCLAVLDIDNDTDKDLLIGGTGFSDLNLLTNGGTANAALITAQDTIYNSATGHKPYLPYWATPTVDDVDGDGIKDLVCGVHLEKDGSADCVNNKIQYLRNIGTNAFPNFTAPNDSFLIASMLDFGANSYPTFFDYDKDGKLDLIVGSEGYIDTASKKLVGQLAFYKNTTVGNNFSFELVTKDLLALSTKKYNGLYPHFADVTGDSVQDLIMGGTNGKLIMYKNTATDNMQTPSFVWQTDSFLNADAGNYSAPSTGDFNKDGKADIIIGNEMGRLIYYEDTSLIPNVKAYALRSTNLGDVRVGGKNNFLGYAAPTFAKIDNTRKEFLMIGTGDGTIERWDSLYNPVYGPYVRIDSFYSKIQTPFRAVPAFGDINNDGYYELVVGNKMGGLLIYNQSKLVDSIPVVIGNAVNNIEKKNNLFQLYPNPAQNTLYIQGLVNNIGAFEIQLYTISGQLVALQRYGNSNLQQFSLENLENGLYSYKLISKNLVQTGSLLKNENK